MATAVVVHLPAGPITTKAELHIDAAEILVVNTPFIGTKQGPSQRRVLGLAASDPCFVE